MGTTTPNFSLYLPAAGETSWATNINDNFTTIDSNLTNALPRSYLAGCQLTNNAGLPLTKVDISAGQAQDNNNAGAMTLTAITKDISAAWTVGTNAGGLATSLTLTAATWYHVFVIKRTDTNVVDVYFDSSVTAANIPASYTLFRRIGSVKTNGSNQILAFVQDGEYFRWKASVLDINTTNPGTAAVTATLASVPTGVNVQAIGNVAFREGTSGTATLYVSDLAANDEAPVGASSAPAAPGSSITSGAVSTSNGFLVVRTNTSAQIRYRLGQSGASDVFGWVTLGWYDSRGRNN